jgi:two-component system chemotaxis sensor kinase CheA
MTSMASIRDTFFEECEDLLAALADGLAAMEAGAQDTETVNAVFRAVHSIKGGAGAFALNDLVTFAHGFETVLDAVRSGGLAADAEVMRLLQRSADHLHSMVESARDDSPADPAQTARFLDQLEACLGPKGFAPADADFAFAAVPLDFGGFGDDTSGGVAGQDFTIIFRPHPSLLANGHDPLLLLASLADLGSMSAEPDLARLPDWETMDAATPCLGWTIRLTGVETEAAIREVFEFVDGLCDLEIAAVQAPDVPDGPAAETTVPLPDQDATGGGTIEDQAASPPSSAKAPGNNAPPAPPLPPTPDTGGGSAEQRGPQPTLRVTLERVDRLINAVGELIINQAMVAQRVQEAALSTDSQLTSHVEDYRLLARDIQEAVMAIRAQPVKPLFQRMSRIVREAAEATGKPARLVTSGDTTEVDKTLIEQLADPLTHMLRNAVDHGLELPEARRLSGKDPCGTIRLSAAHRSGSVILTIGDDGAGLNRPKILEIARRKGLIAPKLELSDAEIDALLFLPGFSTSQAVSNLSGRGVGLDVVRNAVTALGGRIAITSSPGKGTEFTLSLPLTLAVMDGMLISVAGQTLVVPTSSIIETIRPTPDDLHAVGPGESLLRIRGRFIPMVDVASCLGFTRSDGKQPSLLLLVETDSQTQCALIVDAVHHQRQVVIKGLDLNHGPVPGVSAATVLGDGRIALILDTDALAGSRTPTRVASQSLTMEGASHDR